VPSSAATSPDNACASGEDTGNDFGVRFIARMRGWGFRMNVTNGQKAIERIGEDLFLAPTRGPWSSCGYPGPEGRECAVYKENRATYSWPESATAVVDCG